MYEHSKGGEHPEIVGRLGEDGLELVTNKWSKGMVGGKDLFTALDNYLKTNQRRLKEVFQSFDQDGDGQLQVEELSDLLEEVRRRVRGRVGWERGAMTRWVEVGTGSCRWRRLGP